MPLGGYGKSVLVHHKPTITKTHEDDYYLFGELLSILLSLLASLSSFVNSSDYLKDLLPPSNDKERGVRAEPSVILSSEISGFKLEFHTNRRWNS